MDCLQCDQPVKTRGATFCSPDCYHNYRRTGNPIPPKQPHPCAGCGSLTLNPKYCSPQCALPAPKSEAQKLKLSKVMKQRYAQGFHSPASRPEVQAKISKALKGRRSHCKGKIYEEIYGPEKAKELKELRRQQFLKHNPSIVLKGKTYQEIYGVEQATAIKQQQSDAAVGREVPWLTGKTYEEIYGPQKADELRQSRSDTNAQRTASPETRDKIRQIQFEYWSDPEYSNRQRESRCSAPNGAERKLLALLKNNDLAFKYVGDFQLNLGGKFPDFVHAVKPLLIELFGEPWHEPEEEQERIDHFAQFGYRTLVIWCDELKDPGTLILKVTTFITSVAYFF